MRQAFQIPRLGYEYNIKTDLRGTGCEHGEWMQVAQDMVKFRGFVGAVPTTISEALTVVLTKIQDICVMDLHISCT
jgi:hypothetical protein